MEKICSKCKISKDISNFGINKGNKTGLSVWCKGCIRERSRKHYIENKQSYLDNYKKINKQKREWYNELKQDKKCEKCGFTHLAVLDFHHLDPSQKEFNIAEMYGKKGGNVEEKILNEIKKCCILCSNCHRIFHYLERTENMTIQKYLGL